MNCYQKWEPLNKEVENKREGPAGSHGEREIWERASTRKCFINYYCSRLNTCTHSYIQYTCEQSNATEIERPGNEYADMLRSRNWMLVTCIQHIIIVINCYILLYYTRTKDKGLGQKLHKNIIIGIETESNITHNMTCLVSLAVVHEPGAVAAEAEYRKTLKYGVLPSSYSFIPIVVET